MNTGIVILVAAFSFKAILTVVRQALVLAASQIGDVAGYEALSGAFLLLTGLGTVSNLALVVGCCMLATRRRLMPLALAAAAMWALVAGCSLLGYVFGNAHTIVSIAWITGTAAGLTLTVATAESVLGEIRAVWVGIVGVAAGALTVGPFALLQIPDVLDRGAVISAIFFLTELVWVGLLMAVVVVTLVPALSVSDNRT